MRPAREQTYMELCHVWARRSTCVRGNVGAILVVDRRVIAAGYNGSPPRQPHCTDVGCLVRDTPDGEGGCQRAIHAESNAIAMAAFHGVRVAGSTLYSTAAPCLKCAQLIVVAGVEAVVYETPYRLPDGLELLDACSVPVRRWDPAARVSW